MNIYFDIYLFDKCVTDFVSKILIFVCPTMLFKHVQKKNSDNSMLKTIFVS